jgi:hypothetical protein
LGIFASAIQRPNLRRKLRYMPKSIKETDNWKLAANLVAYLLPAGHPSSPRDFWANSSSHFLKPINYEQFNCFKQTKHLPMVAKSSKLLETDEAFNCFGDSKVRFLCGFVFLICKGEIFMSQRYCLKYTSHLHNLGNYYT